MPGWSSLFKPLTDAPTRAGRRISDAMEPYEPIQQDGKGGLQDWLGWTDASAKGLLQGSTEAAGGVISDMTSPFSIGMQALGAGGLKRLAGLARLGRNASRVGAEAPAIESAVSRLGPEFAAVGDEAAVNSSRAANMASEAKDIAAASRKGNVQKSTMGATRPEELIESTVKRKPLPQIDDAYAGSGENFAGINLGSKGTSVYKPEVSKEMGRLMVEMLDDGTAKDAFKIAQDKYPRLMGHVDEIKIGAHEGHPGFFDRLRSGGSSGQPYSGMPGNNNVSTIRIDPASPMNWSPEGMANSVGHELAHSAQRLRKGNNRFNTSYSDAQRSIGYKNNPYEISADRSGRKFSKYAMRDE